MGIRPTLPDSLPVIDLHPKYPQIGMVFGHHHLGVTQAAISAQLISALMTGLGANQMQESYFSNPNAFTVKRF
jgi:D-amino-acid dehydrogenase